MQERSENKTINIGEKKEKEKKDEQKQETDKDER